MQITSSGKPVSEPRLQPPAKPAPPRPWPYDPDEVTLLTALNCAIWHYAGIRATGSVPDVGGPSAQITNPHTAAAPQFRNAAEAAEAYWPNARSFDLIGADLLYKEAAGEELPAGLTRFRNAALICSFTVTDRGPAPSGPAAPPTDATDPDLQTAGKQEPQPPAAPQEPAQTQPAQPDQQDGPQAHQDGEAAQADLTGNDAADRATNNDPTAGIIPTAFERDGIGTNKTV